MISLSFAAAILPLILPLYWTLGALLLRRSIPSARVFSLGDVHWLAAYPLGLMANLVVAFSLDQFAGLALSSAALLTIALVLLSLAALLPRPPAALPGLATAPATPGAWSIGEIGLALAVVALLAARHALDGPLGDWDSVMYHLPLADVLRGGHFPDEIGRSYIRQYEAAFPPMLYFQYALFPGEVAVAAPRLFALAVDAALCWLAWHVAQRLLGAPRRFALAAALAWAAIANVDPNTQSLTAVYFLLALVYGADAFRAQAAEPAETGPSTLLPIILLGAGCYWNSYLGAGLLAVLYPAFASHALGEGLRGRPRAFRWGRWAAAACATIALLIPHLLRNALVAGNPLYPAFVEVLGGAGITEWFLANRPAAGTSLQDAWSLIALSFAYWRPWPQVVLCGFAAALLSKDLPAPRRAPLLTILGGFFLVWMLIYQRDNTPLDRFLFPVAALAVSAVAYHLAQLARMANARAALQATYLLAIPATALPGLEFLRAGGVPSTPFLAYLGVWTLGLWWLDARLGPRLDGPPILAQPSAERAFAIAPRAGFAAALMLGGAVFAGATNWSAANQFRVPITPDLDWLNEHLDESDTVLLFDGRILGLQRKYLAADDLRLEAFGRAPNPKLARRELEALGISHFYYSREASGGLAPSFKLDFFVPHERNKRVKLVYTSETGWIVELL